MEDHAIDGFYLYHPSLGTAIVFTIFFTVLAGVHFYLSHWPSSQCYSPNCTANLWLCTAALHSTIGFATRIGSITIPNNGGPYGASYCFIFLAPLFLSAFLYVSFADVVRRCLRTAEDRRLLGFTPSGIVRTFVVSDLVSYPLQCAGFCVAAESYWVGHQATTVGMNILLAGLSLQLATFTVFMLLLSLFGMRVDFGHRSNSLDTERRIIKGIRIAGVLVLIRSVFRMIEFGLGFFAYPFTHEWLFYVLEAIPMVIALAVLGVYHPARWRQG